LYPELIRQLLWEYSLWNRQVLPDNSS
jgi:hypothetical protein